MRYAQFTPDSSRRPFAIFRKAYLCRLDSNLGESKLYFMCLDEIIEMVYYSSSLEVLLFGDSGPFLV